MSFSMAEKIAFLTSYLPSLGGSEFANAELASGLKRRGHEVIVISQPYDGDKEYDLISEKDMGIPVTRVPYTFGYGGIPPAPEQTATVNAFVAEQLERNRPDAVILGHDSWSWYRMAARGLDLPTIQYLHGTPTRALAQGIFTPEKTVEFLDNIRDADHVIVVAEHFRQLMIAYGIPKSDITTVYNGVDFSLFNTSYSQEELSTLRAGLEIPADAKVVMHASNHYPVKRVTDIAASAEHVIAEMPNVFYLIVGEGPETALLKETIGQSPYASHFRVPGKVPYSEMPKHMLISDLFVLASESEGYPRVGAEAQAIGLPLLISDMPAGLEQTAQGKYGFTFSMGNIGDLAGKTMEILSMSPDALGRMTDRAEAYVSRHLSRAHQLDSVEAIIGKVLGKGKTYFKAAAGFYSII